MKSKVKRMNRTIKYCIFEEFRFGKSTKSLARKHSMPLLVVEQIIREHVL